MPKTREIKMNEHIDLNASPYRPVLTYRNTVARTWRCCLCRILHELAEQGEVEPKRGAVSHRRSNNYNPGVHAQSWRRAPQEIWTAPLETCAAALRRATIWREDEGVRRGEEEEEERGKEDPWCALKGPPVKGGELWYLTRVGARRGQSTQM